MRRAPVHSPRSSHATASAGRCRLEAGAPGHDSGSQVVAPGPGARLREVRRRQEQNVHRARLNYPIPRLPSVCSFLPWLGPPFERHHMATVHIPICNSPAGRLAQQLPMSPRSEAQEAGPLLRSRSILAPEWEGQRPEQGCSGYEGEKTGARMLRLRKRKDRSKDAPAAGEDPERHGSGMEPPAKRNNPVWRRALRSGAFPL